MRLFKYKAKDPKGVVVVGEVEAATDQAAARLVRQKGLIVVAIHPVKKIPFNIFAKLANRITSGDTATFTRQLSTMINAGLPITEALLILRTQAKSSMQKVVSAVLSDVEEGESLSSSMAKHPNAFNKTYIAIIRSGEIGGVMEEVLVRLADNLEKNQEFRGKVKGALIYPVIVIIGMVIVAFIMMVFVIPRLTTLYEQFDAELPLSTKLLIATSDIMQKFWPILILLVGGAAWGFKLYRNTQTGRRKTDEIILKTPIIGSLQHQIILTELTRTLSLMVGSGVSILEGLAIGAQVVGNKVISDALIDATKMVEKGFPLAYAFSRHPDAFPFILSQMIAVGEETGQMDEVLEKVSHVFEVESEQRVKSLTAAVEPIILIFLGVGVAFLVISIILPIYNLTTQL